MNPHELQCEFDESDTPLKGTELITRLCPVINLVDIIIHRHPPTPGKVSHSNDVVERGMQSDA